MTAKRPPKKTPAEAGAERMQSFIEWRRDHPIWELLSRRPFELSDDETSLVLGRIDAAMAGVRRGWSSSAIDLLMISEAYLRAGYAPPEPLCSWLADRLRDTASHDVPWGIPLLRRSKGQKSADRWVEELVVGSFYGNRRESGEKHEVAWRETQEFLGFLFGDLTEDKIKNYWRKHRSPPG